MTTELTMLAYAVILLIVLIVVQSVAGIRLFGLPALAGSRDMLPPPTGFAGRMKRVVDNHREGLTMFAPLVLIAAVAHISSQHTVIGAEMFFWSRLVHAGCYVAGLPYARTLAFAVGVVGMVLILAAILGLA